MEEYIFTPEFLMQYIIPDEIADFIIEDEDRVGRRTISTAFTTGK